MSAHGARMQQLIPDRVRAVSDRLKTAMWEPEDAPLSVSGGHVADRYPDVRRLTVDQFTAVENGEEFGPTGGGFAYRAFHVEIPPSGIGGERYLFWDCDGEATVYIDDAPWAGIDLAHNRCPVPQHGLEVTIVVGTYERGIWIGPSPMHIDAPCRFRRTYTAVRKDDVWNLYWDVEILRQLMDHHLLRSAGSLADGAQFHPPIDRAPVVLRKLLAGLDAAADAIDGGAFPEAARIVEKIYAALPGSPSNGRVNLVGHSHLDLVWLWPERITYDKAVHTTATALRMVDRYPELIYSASTPHIYRQLGLREPAMADRIGELVAAGRWEATGGMYVEADVNLPCGEGLARALLYGQQSFEELRNEPSRLTWLPDVFGYPSCLPQIMRLAGVEGFFTTKLSWSAVTRFPYTVFRWRSPDGSHVLAYQSSVGYNEPVTVDSVTRCAEENTQAGIHDRALLPVGYGDGGGGITEEMVESARRLRSLADVPEVQWVAAEDHFRRLAESADDLPEYEGELYLEYHRGTLTTHGRFKQQYRACERAFQLREAVRAVLGFGPLGADDWRRVLFSQFHDALPGSSIGTVYAELEPELAAVEHRQTTAAANELATAAGAGATDGRLARRWVFNPIPLPRTIVVEDSGQDGPAAAVGLARCPGVGLFPVTGSGTAPPGFREATPQALDNGTVRVEFNDHGMACGLTVRGHRYLLSGTNFVLCPDYPAKYDAWEIDYAAPSLGTPVLVPLGLSVTEHSAFRAVLEGAATLGAASHGLVRYLLPAEGEYLFVELTVDWAESHQLLRFDATTGYRGRDAVYGEPFGSVARRQSPGLQSDSAKWEAAGQRWAAVCNDTRSEGIAVITEAKYGFSCADGRLGVSLLRAPNDPDPEADRGPHTIRFAIGPYRTRTDGDALSTAATAETAYGPATSIGGVRAPADAGRAPISPTPLIRFGRLGSLTPSWIKPAENGNGMVIRLHECAGEAGTAVLNLNRRLTGNTPPEIVVGDFLERPTSRAPLARREPGPAGEHRYELPYRPYEILSLMVATRVSSDWVTAATVEP